MLVNAYAVLDVLLGAVRLGVAALVLGMALSASADWRRAGDGEARTALESRCYLLFLLAAVLVVLNVLSWPVYYLLLQSYVPEWPGVMCVYGVTRVGEGSLGSSRFLPGLVRGLEVAKPALVFLSGAWVALYLVNRRTATAPLTGRVLLLAAAAGLLGVADAAAELTYLFIPKREVFVSAGCCTEALAAGASGSRWLPPALLGGGEHGRLLAAYLGANLAMVGGLWAARRACRRVPGWGWVAAGATAAVVTTAVNAVFLVEVAAPRLLGLPDHRCWYDLIPHAPEGLAAFLLAVAGAFCVGWAVLVAALARGPEARAAAPRVLRGLLRAATLAYLWSVVMMSAGLLLA